MFGRIGMTSTTEVRLVVDINVLVSSLMHGELSGFSPVLAIQVPSFHLQ